MAAGAARAAAAAAAAAGAGYAEALADDRGRQPGVVGQELAGDERLALDVVVVEDLLDVGVDALREEHVGGKELAHRAGDAVGRLALLRAGDVAHVACDLLDALAAKRQGHEQMALRLGHVAGDVQRSRTAQIFVGDGADLVEVLAQ